MPVQLIPSLNSGELSPRLESRPDLEKYGSGCRTLENFLIMPYGGINRRPGLAYMGTAKNANKKARLVGFNFSTTTNFILEFGELYIRFWSNGVQVVKTSATSWSNGRAYVPGNYVTQTSVIYYCLVAHTSGTFSTDLAAGKWVAQTILEVPAPYLEADIFDLQYVQINDVMYITHPSYAVRKLSRLADDNWKLETVEWKYPPMRDENTTAITIAGSATSGNSITLTASAPAWAASTDYDVGQGVLQSSTIYKCLVAHTSGSTFSNDLATGKWEAQSIFTSSNVGGYFEITHKRAGTASIQQPLSANGTSSSMRVIGEWQFSTNGGAWTGTIEIQRSLDGSIWETVRSFKSTSDRHVTTTGTEEEEEVYMRIKVTSAGDGWAHLDAVEGTVYGLVKVTAVSSATSATAKVIKELNATTATAFWSEGAWSDRRGHPRTVTLHEQRLMFGGNAAQAQTIWGSAVNDFETFRRLTFDDSPITFTIASQETNPINWMVSQQVLEVGTAGYEYVVSSSNSDAALTPTNIQVKAQSHFGSKYANAVVANEVTLFVQRQGRKIREFVFNFERDGYISADLTLLADHVTSGGIVQIAFQQQPDAILWAVTGSGTLAGMTYERGQNVVGWHRHTTDGMFESAASIYGSAGADEVWCVVKRTIGGVDKRLIERFDPLYRETLENETAASWWYLDGAKLRTGSPTTTITGLSHLEGKTVSILGDGDAVTPQVVASGQITLPAAKSTVLVGLPFTSLVQPMPLDPGMLQDGTAQGRKFRIHRMVARIYKSKGGEIEVQDGQWDAITDTTSEPDAATIFTGDKERMIARGYEGKATIKVRQTQPFPLTILGFVPKYDVLGD